MRLARWLYRKKSRLNVIRKMRESPIVNKNLISPVSGPIEKTMKLPVVLTMIILYQGFFSESAVSIPSRLQAVLDKPIIRFISILSVAISATGDVEYAIAATLLFLTFLYVIKTKEEREETGFV